VNLGTGKSNIILRQYEVPPVITYEVGLPHITQEVPGMKEVYYVGLDAHKHSIQMAVLDNRKKEPITAKGCLTERPGS
jgi:hypothetical protein